MSNEVPATPVDETVYQGAIGIGTYFIAILQPSIRHIRNAESGTSNSHIRPPSPHIKTFLMPHFSSACYDTVRSSTSYGRRGLIGGAGDADDLIMGFALATIY